MPLLELTSRDYADCGGMTGSPEVVPPDSPDKRPIRK